METQKLNSKLNRRLNSQHAASFRRVRKIAKIDYLASSYLSVCLSVRMEPAGPPWTNFHYI